MSGRRSPALRGFCLQVTVADVAEAERVFAALAEAGGTTRGSREVSSRRFGLSVDRFGVPWMVDRGPSAGTSGAAA